MPASCALPRTTPWRTWAFPPVFGGRCTPRPARASEPRNQEAVERGDNLPERGPAPCQCRARGTARRVASRPARCFNIESMAQIYAAIEKDPPLLALVPERRCSSRSRDAFTGATPLDATCPFREVLDRTLAPRCRDHNSGSKEQNLTIRTLWRSIMPRCRKPVGATDKQE